MKIIKALQLSKKQYYKTHLLIINNLLPVQMTPREAEILAAFMSLEGDIKRDPFGTSGRKLVREIVGVSAGGLGNYLDQLKKKGFIRGANRDLKILPILIPENKIQLYQFKLEVTDGSN